MACREDVCWRGRHRHRLGCDKAITRVPDFADAARTPGTNLQQRRMQKYGVQEKSNN